MPPLVADMFYQAVVVAVVLCGSKTWCLPATARRPFEGFHIVNTIRDRPMLEECRGADNEHPPPP